MVQLTSMMRAWVLHLLGRLKFAAWRIGRIYSLLAAHASDMSQPELFLIGVPLYHQECTILMVDIHVNGVIVQASALKPRLLVSASFG